MNDFSRINDDEEPDWRRFEKAVARRHQEMGFNVEHDVAIWGRSGQKYQLDLVLRHKLGIYEFYTTVECKYLNKRVGQPIIRQFKGLMDDLEGFHGVIVSKKGFTIGAKKYAEEYHIDLVVPTITGLASQVIEQLRGLADVIQKYGAVFILGAGLSSTENFMLSSRLKEIVLHSLREARLEKPWDMYDRDPVKCWNMLENNPVAKRSFVTQFISRVQSPTQAQKYLAWLISKGFARTVLTLNYDEMLENAYAQVTGGKRLNVIVKPRDFDFGRTTLWKLHGSISYPSSLRLFPPMNKGLFDPLIKMLRKFSPPPVILTLGVGKYETVEELLERLGQDTIVYKIGFNVSGERAINVSSEKALKYLALILTNSYKRW